MYAILGPSGCGKTTLLSLLSGLDSPASGQILYQGAGISKSGLADHRRSHVAFIFQSYNLIDYLTPMENVVGPDLQAATAPHLGAVGIDRRGNEAEYAETVYCPGSVCSITRQFSFHLTYCGVVYRKLELFVCSF